MSLQPRPRIATALIWLIGFFAVLYTAVAAGGYYAAAVSGGEKSIAEGWQFGILYTITAALAWTGLMLLLRARAKPAAIVTIISGVLSIPIGLLLVAVGVSVLLSKRIGEWAAANRRPGTGSATPET